MSVGRIWQTENQKIWQKKKEKIERKNNNNPRRLERDTFCALSERSPSSELTDYKKKASGKSFKTTTSHPITQ